jgi:aminoglycoside phosphotransferase (APT) family kinase protein
VVKIRRQATDLAKLQSQVEATRLAAAAGVPTTEVLYAGLSAALGGRPVVILRYIPGTDAEEALPAFDGPQRSQFFADFGAAVGRLLQIRLPHFTERIGSPGAAVGDWATLVRRITDRYAPWNDKIAALTPLEVAAIRERLVQSVAAVTDVVSPMLTHRDLYLANVLVNEGRFAAILDFELAKGYDPLLDFVKLGAFIFERHPERIEPFTAAYRHHSDRLAQAEERLALCLALDQFVQVPNWALLGEEQLLRNSCRRLRDWLQGWLPWWTRRIGVVLA